MPELCHGRASSAAPDRAGAARRPAPAAERPAQAARTETSKAGKEGKGTRPSAAAAPVPGPADPLP
eukprot:7204984-Pyramimonas_sp.AAC.1